MSEPNAPLGLTPNQTQVDVHRSADTLVDIFNNKLDVHLHLDPAQYRTLLWQAAVHGRSLTDELLGDYEPPHVPWVPERGGEWDGFSVIGWVNKPEMFQQLVLPAFAPQAGFQRTPHPVEFIAVPPEVGAKNIGEAYDIARKLARYRIKIYVHQDAMPVDWTYLEKVRAAHMAGIAATGVIGCRVPTGAAWFHGPGPSDMTGYVDMGSGRIMGVQDTRARVVDGLVFTCSEDIAWPDYYEGPHMAIEDMCMRIEAAGRQVWSLSTTFVHLSPGTMDEAFWRSVETFRREWHHRLPSGLPSIEALRERSAAERASIGIDMEGKPTPEALALIERNRAAREPIPIGRGATPRTRAERRAQTKRR